MSKVLVLGIDSLDPRIIDFFSGKLKNFQKLNRAKIETTIPPETPVAWSAAATGMNPGVYGIFDFLNRNPDTYKPQLNLAHEKRGIFKVEYESAMKGIPFWRILTNNKIPITVIRWPVTFPPEKVNGKMISGLGVVDIKGLLGKYSFYTDEKHDTRAEGAEKVVPVKINEKVIETYVSGPLISKKGELKDIRTPIKITLFEDKAEITVANKTHTVKNSDWSNMIKIEFKFLLTKVSAIFKVYLDSIKPFRMYMTSIQIDPEDQFFKITYPEDYGKELVNQIGLFYTLGMPSDTKAVTEGRMSKEVFLQQIHQIEEEREKMLFYELENFKQGVLAFVFDAGDRMKHIFWDNNSLDEKGNLKSIPKEIEEYYVLKDKLLGKIMSNLDDTKLIVLSDHGFSSFKFKFNMNTWLVNNNYMKRDSQESLFKGVDWSKTKAYSLGFTSIYLNQKNRESKGIVNKVYSNKLIEEIIEKLRKIEHNNKKVFTNLYKGSDIYQGEYSYLAPDIVVGFSPGYRMSDISVIGGTEENVISDNKSAWFGDHLIDRSHVPGAILTNFKIKKNPKIIDVAPTLLKLCGITIPKYMEGSPLV